jgi:hypothetical protein
MIRAGIMQPYFVPYIGYFQLIHSVDVFVIYDRAKYTKKGWINRNVVVDNRLQQQNISIALNSAPDWYLIAQREISPTFDRKKILRRLREYYGDSPHFEAGYSLVQEILDEDTTNLFLFLENSIRVTCRTLSIETQILPSSEVESEHSLLRAEKRVLDICGRLGASRYVNAIGGVDLYSEANFSSQGVELWFLRTYPENQLLHVEYRASIIDTIFRLGIDKTAECVSSGYELIPSIESRN